MKKEWWHTKMMCRNAESGFSLIEALLSAALLAIIVGVFVGALSFGEESARVAGERARAALIAEEGLEAARNIRDASISNLTTGTFGLSTTSNIWNLVGTSATIDLFSRSIGFSAFATSSLNTRRKFATTTVSWQPTLQRSGQVILETYLTDWRRSFANWAAPSQESNVALTGTAALTRVRLYRTPTSTFAVLTRANSVNPELYVFNVTNPASLTQVGSVDLGAAANDVALTTVGGVLYAVIASANTALEVQVVNLQTFTVVGTLNLAGANAALSVVASGSVAFIGKGSSASPELYAVSIAAGGTPSLLGTALELGANVNELALAQNGPYIYAATSLNTGELMVINISNPAAMSLSFSLDLALGSDGTAVTTFGTFIGLGRNDGSVWTIDGSTPTSPISLGSVTVSTGQINDLASGVGDIYLFAGTATAGTAFAVVNVAITTAPAVLSTLGLTNSVNGVAWDFDLNRAFLANNGGQLLSIKPN